MGQLSIGLERPNHFAGAAQYKSENSPGIEQSCRDGLLMSPMR